MPRATSPEIVAGPISGKFPKSPISFSTTFATSVASLPSPVYAAKVCFKRAITSPTGD